MSDAALADLVARVVADSPPIADTVEALAPHDRRELDRLVKRDRITPDAALAVIRGRRARQLAALDAPTEARTIAAAIRQR